jgi:hypothetical protein
MMRHRFGRLLRNADGKAPVKLVLSATLLAMSFAMASPAFRTNPILARVMGAAGGDMEKILPQSLEKVTEALRGVS